MGTYQKDLASVDFDLLQRIWPGTRCLLSGRREIQWHHIKGRGRKKDDEHRKIHSSPLGVVPIIEDIHMFAPLHDRSLENWFLEKAEEKVMAAVRMGYYELTEIDRQFRELYPLFT